MNFRCKSEKCQVRNHGEFCTCVELFDISPCLGKASILIQRIRMQKGY